MRDESPLDVTIHPSQPCGVLDLRRTQAQTTRIREPFAHVSAETYKQDQALAAFFLGIGAYPTSQGFNQKACPSCHACLPSRLVLADFKETRELRQIRRKNSDIDLTLQHGLPALMHARVPTDIVRLFNYYQRTRFKSTQPLMQSYRQLQSYYGYAGMDVYSITARDRESRKLAGCIVFHKSENVAYGTTHFYDPALRSQGIGHHLVLGAIDTLKTMGINMLYLGDWTPEPSGLSWKAKYSPIELYIDSRWQVHDKADLEALRPKGRTPYPSPRRLVTP